MEKIVTARSCLEAFFAEVREERSSKFHHFVLHDGAYSFELIFDRSFLDHIRPEQLAWFQEHMASQIIPVVKANAGKRIFISDRGIELSGKDSS